VKAAPFSYHAPASLDDAVAVFGAFGDEAKVIAGGQSLVPMMALRLARFDHLVDLSGIAQLRGVQRQNGSLVIGAMTTHRELEHGAGSAVPLLARAAPYIGHTQIRNRGTFGGSCAHADPAAEWPAVAVALSAEFDVLGANGRRAIAAADFFVSTFMTALETDEILTSVTIPVWGDRSGFGVAEFARRHGDFAVAGAVVGLQLDETERVVRAAIGLMGLGPVPIRASAAESAAIGSGVDSLDLGDLARLAVAGCDPADDIHGDAAFRRRVGAVTVEQALEQAIQEARSD
jgi:carbon-monoxide dehydrogenase medium subunit